MVLAQFKPARVNIDYHVAFEGHYELPAVFRLPRVDG
jgi:hypothetical protein